MLLDASYTSIIRLGDGSVLSGKAFGAMWYLKKLSGNVVKQWSK
jgi:hypothetical protein